MDFWFKSFYDAIRWFCQTWVLCECCLTKQDKEISWSWQRARKHPAVFWGFLFTNYSGVLRRHLLVFLKSCLSYLITRVQIRNKKCPRSGAGGLEAGKSCVSCTQAEPKESQRVANLHLKCIILDPYATLRRSGRGKSGSGRVWFSTLSLDFANGRWPKHTIPQLPHQSTPSLFTCI